MPYVWRIDRLRQDMQIFCYFNKTRFKMTVYLISYDLHPSEGKEHFKAIEKALHKIADNSFSKVNRSTYFVDSKKHAQEIEETLKSMTDYKGSVLIIALLAQSPNVKIEGENKESAFNWLFSDKRNWT